MYTHVPVEILPQKRFLPPGEGSQWIVVFAQLQIDLWVTHWQTAAAGSLPIE